MKNASQLHPTRTLAQHFETANGDIDARLLRWLLHYNLQRIEDMALGIQATEQTVRRHLQTLQDAHLVESFVYAYHSQIRQTWYHLTDTGIKLAAAMEQLTGAEAVQLWQTNERHLLHLFPRLPVMICVQNMINAAIIEAPEMLARYHNPTAIRWRWQRAYQISFEHNKQQSITCATDAAVVLRRARDEEEQVSANKGYEYFVLWVYADLGKTGGWSRQLMTARLRHLLLYRESQERQIYRGQFPLVLILTESELQVERWQQAVYDATYGLKVATPLTGAILNRTTQTPEESIWSGKWQILGGKQFSSLRTLLQPITREAIPAGILPTMPPLPSTLPPIPPVTSSQKFVRGKYQQRVDQIVQKPTRSTKEREIIDLLGLSMSQRYRDVLLLLYAHPLVNVKELSILLEISEQSINRYLWSLSRWYCVESIKHEDTSLTEKRWKLTERGLRYLAASQRLPTSVLLQTDEEGTIWQSGVYMLQKQLRHTAGLYQFLTAFYQAQQERADHQIIWSESHTHCARRYQYQGQWHNFRPDATVLYQQGIGMAAQRWLLWLEWDGATMSREQLREKLHSYACYMHSREWRRLGYSVGTPLLVFVTPKQGQANAFRELVEETLTGTQIHVYIGLRNLLEQHGVLAPIWVQAMPIIAEKKPTLKMLFGAG